MSLTKLTSELMRTGARVGPMRFLGAVNPVYEAEGAGAGAPSGNGEQAAAAAAAQQPAGDGKPATILGGAGDGAAAGAAKAGEGEAEGEGDKSGKGEETPEAKAEREKAEKKAARKAELDAMSPEDREKAEAEDAEADRLAAVPEDGVYDLRMPEGVTVDNELLAEVAPEFKELGLTNGQAQKLADKFTGLLKKRGETKAKEWSDRLAGWADTAKADPEIGGDKWDVTVLNADKAMRKFGTPALKEYLESSGGGNFPELIRAFARAGATIADDDPAITETPGNPKPTADTAERMYPDDKPKGK